MKKIKFLLGIMLIFLFIISGCGKSNSKLVGIWISDNSATLEFLSNGTGYDGYMINGALNRDEEFTYEVNQEDGIIYITYKGCDPRNRKYAINNNTLMFDGVKYSRK